MRRRLKEDRNQHYEDLSCACYHDKKAQARFKEQPKGLQCTCCSSQRYNKWLPLRERLTMQERKHLDAWHDSMVYVGTDYHQMDQVS